MYLIQKDLTVGNNLLDSYLPIRNKNDSINWQLVTGLVLSYAMKRKIDTYSEEQYREDCKKELQELLDNPTFWSVIERMYFNSQGFYQVSPLFLLFHAQFQGERFISGSAVDKRLGTFFANLMGDLDLKYPLQDKLNFIEEIILDKLKDKVAPLEKSPFAKEQPYLPYMSKCFQADLTFLADHPQYLLQELTNTLRLYAFSWCAQLALNLDDWEKGEPQSKPLFFIIDTEKASSERVQIHRYGYKLFSKQSEKIFPILSALEGLQSDEKSSPKRPLWQVYKDCVDYSDSAELLSKLNEYLQKFIDDRNLEKKQPALNLKSVFSQLLIAAVEQFKNKRSHRAEVNRRYIKDLESHICNDFIQVRGRSGKVLVLNQDQLLLLTNLTIGSNTRLRLHELIKGFRQRGFYLDNQSTQILVAFYERMGNVERMSDSGDAVYVRKTI